MAFYGFVQQEGNLVIDVLARNSSGTPVTLDAPPTYRIYGPGGLMASGTGTATALDAGNVTGLYSLTVAALGANGYMAGGTYAVLLSGAISSVAWGELHTFCVG